MNLHGLYRDQFKFLRENGYEVTGLAPAGEEHEWLREQGFKTKVIHLKRPPSIFHDLYSLFQLTWFLTFNRFDIINISTPKASLIGALAASSSFHKNIVYNLRGRAYESTTGLTRRIFEKIEKLICTISSIVLCDSKEIREDVISMGLCKEKKIFVFGSGSSNGVDLGKFTRTDNNIEEGRIIRKSLGIGQQDILILNSGRLRKDKGINELVRAFNSLSKTNLKIHLLLQGKYESFDPLEKEVVKIIDNHTRIHQAGWVKDVENYFAAAQIFAFPSHREGFGNVAIEASAMELPVLAFDVVGCRESIKENVSGLLCKELSVQHYEEGLRKLIVNPDLRKMLGQKGRLRVENEFDSFKIWKELVKVYNFLSDNGEGLYRDHLEKTNCRKKKPYSRKKACSGKIHVGF